MDEFKKYLLENKDQLQPEEPDEKVWEQVSNRISMPVVQTPVWLMFKKLIAACIIVLAGTGVYFLIRTNQDTPDKYVKTPTVNDTANKTATNKQIDTVPVVVVPAKDNIEKKTGLNIPSEKPLVKNELVKRATHRKNGKLVVKDHDVVDEYLASLTPIIENQKTIISSTPVFGVDREYFSGFVTQYRLLEQHERSLKEKINTTGITSQTLDEMIRNLKTRIELLMLLKAEIDKVNEANKNRTSEKTYIDII